MIDASSAPTDGLPTYRELTDRSDAPARSSWGLFGSDDELGTINFLTPDRVAAATSRVRTGEVHRLDVPLDFFTVQMARHRAPLKHVIFGNGYNHRDDRLESLYLQSSSQIDGLRHARQEGAGFYNGVRDEEITEANPRLGIGAWARHGLVGTGLLVDVEGHLRRTRGRGLDHDNGEQISPALLDEVLAAQGCSLEPGTIVLMRTGWLAWYGRELSEDQRQSFPQRIRCAGIEQSEQMLAWLWDHRVAMLASDNLAVEALPVRPETPYFYEKSGQDGLYPGMMHPALIALLGLALGELWKLDPLAESCHRDGRYESMVVANPLLLDAAVGSPANAVAIR